MNVLAFEVNVHLGFLFQFVYRQGHGDSGDVIDMTGDAFELGFNVVAQRGGNVEVNAGDFQVHNLTPSWKNATSDGDGPG